MQSKTPRAFESLKSEKAIQEVFQKGERKSSSSFNLYYLKENKENVLRLSVFISKRKVRKAVERNKLRRIIKEFFRTQARNLRGYNIICVVRSLVNVGVNFGAIAQELESLVQKIL